MARRRPPTAPPVEVRPIDDAERIRRAVEDGEYLSDVAPLLAAEVRRLREELAEAVVGYVHLAEKPWCVRSARLRADGFATREEAAEFYRTTIAAPMPSPRDLR